MYRFGGETEVYSGIILIVEHAEGETMDYLEHIINHGNPAWCSDARIISPIYCM